jgi:hypothetical protein
MCEYTLVECLRRSLMSRVLFAVVGVVVMMVGSGVCGDSVLVQRDTVWLVDTVVVSGEMSAYEDSALTLVNEQIAQQWTIVRVQFPVVVISVVTAFVGWWIRRRQIRDTERTARADRDKKAHSEYTAAFSDPSNPASVRLAAATELGRLAAESDPHDCDKYPFRDHIIRLLLESVDECKDQATLETVADVLGGIGIPALRPLLTENKRRFSSETDWMVETDDEDVDEPDFDRMLMSQRALMHAIGLILRTNPYSLVKTSLSGDDQGVFMQNLRGVDLNHASLRQSSFVSVNLRQSTLDGARFDDARFWLCTLSQADLFLSGFSGVLWRNVECVFTSFDNAHFEYADVKDCDLKKSPSFPDAHLEGCNWWEADTTEDQKKVLKEKYPETENRPKFELYWQIRKSRLGKHIEPWKIRNRVPFLVHHPLLMRLVLFIVRVQKPNPPPSSPPSLSS